ncbi:MAG: WXG100 family type VII secretion target [Nocardioides sp.]|uniref:WXG100 family type VII secretion target n=1 Tax=Nocardioides sp. TaxID=35761 RepID=UPI003F0B939D
MSGFAVELADLRGYGRQVSRAGAGCAGVGDYLASHVTDGDFGMILELLTMEYESMIPSFTEVLTLDGERLKAAGVSLTETAADYAETDRNVSQEFGVGRAITDDKRAQGFYDVAGVLPVPAPSCDTAELPKVSFGFVLDKICDLTNWIIGIDPREYVTKWIAGDIEKAALHASAWQHVSDCLDKAERNLASGASAISATWTGGASRKAQRYMERWTDALAKQSNAMAKVSTHLKDMIRGAVDLAQNVVDIIRMIISICSAAISSSYIPLWGQWKAVKTIKEAWELFKTARKAIMAFWQIITTFKNLIISFVHAITAESLPDVPAVPA